jgi:hypothetical protein
MLLVLTKLTTRTITSYISSAKRRHRFLFGPRTLPVESGSSTSRNCHNQHQISKHTRIDSTRTPRPPLFTRRLSSIYYCSKRRKTTTPVGTTSSTVLVTVPFLSLFCCSHLSVTRKSNDIKSTLVLEGFAIGSIAKDDDVDHFSCSGPLLLSELPSSAARSNQVRP